MGIFKSLFGIKEKTEHKVLEEVKMKIKVTKSEPTPFSSNYMSSGTTMTQKSQNKDPVYISLKSQVIVKDSRLKFIQLSKKTGYPIYEVISDDKSFLSKYKGGYTEVIMSPTTPTKSTSRIRSSI